MTSWSSLSRDGRMLFVTRGVRLFGYGLISIILVLYLAEIGVPEPGIGLLHLGGGHRPGGAGRSSMGSW